MQIINLRDAAFSAARHIENVGDFATTGEIAMGDATVPLLFALLLWEERLGALATELGRGPVPLALNQARTALAGAIALHMLDDAIASAGLVTQLYLAAGFCQRAMREGSAVGSG